MTKRNIVMAVGVIAIFAVLGLVFAAGKERKGSARESQSSLSAQQLYEQAVKLQGANEVLGARDAYQELVANYPDFKEINLAQKNLEDLNIKIIFSAIQTPGTATHEIAPGDSLIKIAKKYGTTVELLKRSNSLNSDIIRAGQKLRVWKGSFSVFVDKSQNILILKSDDEVVKVYTVATGANNITPAGTFKIANKLVNPVWFKSGAIIPPESPANVLGSRWMGFDIPGYGIHGTTEPDKLGQQVTAGCIRMHNSDAEELFDILPEGSTVTIVD